MCQRLLWIGSVVLFASSHATGQSGPTLVGSGYGSPPYVSVAGPETRAKLTVNPDDALAESVIGASPQVMLFSGLKLMV